MTANADFYDRAMTASDALAMRPLDKSPWLAMYHEAAGWIAASEPVIDLGCGTGRFAVACALEGHDGGYTGLDFAPGVVAQARDYITATVPDYPAEVRQADLQTWKPADIRAGNTVYVSLEVLEHLADDLDLIRRIPGGHRLIFSVPNYGSTSHVRRFPSPQSIWDRYGQLLKFRRWSLITVSETHAIHMVDAIRRVDSWL